MLSIRYNLVAIVRDYSINGAITPNLADTHDIANFTTLIKYLISRTKI